MNIHNKYEGYLNDYNHGNFSNCSCNYWSRKLHKSKFGGPYSGAGFRLSKNLIQYHKLFFHLHILE